MILSSNFEHISIVSFSVYLQNVKLHIVQLSTELYRVTQISLKIVERSFKIQPQIIFAKDCKFPTTFLYHQVYDVILNETHQMLNFF